MITGWRSWLKNKRNQLEFFITLFAGMLVLTFIPDFFNYVESRNGVVFEDVILNLFNPVDLTWPIFSIIYLSLICAFVSIINKPAKLIFAIQFYLLLMVVRMTSMYFVPLDPPPGIISLADPFIQLITTGEVLQKDLFFSGHTATLFFLFLISDKIILKKFFLIATAVVAIMVILQHVHYTIDVFAAPFFAYSTYRLILLIRQKINLNY